MLLQAQLLPRSLKAIGLSQRVQCQQQNAASLQQCDEMIVEGRDLRRLGAAADPAIGLDRRFPRRGRDGGQGQVTEPIGKAAAHAPDQCVEFGSRPAIAAI